MLLLRQIFDFFDTDRTGSVHGANVERMLFLVRLFRGSERAALTTSPCTSQLGYIVEPNTIKKSRLYTLDGAGVFGCQGVV